MVIENIPEPIRMVSVTNVPFSYFHGKVISKIVEVYDWNTNTSSMKIENPHQNFIDRIFFVEYATYFPINVFLSTSDRCKFFKNDSWQCIMNLRKEKNLEIK